MIDDTVTPDLPKLDARISSVMRYWDDLRGDRVAPGRIEIKPTAITRHLSRIAILERPRAGTVRLRLVGAALSSRLGLELRGMPFRALFDLDHRIEAMSAAEAAISTPSVILLAIGRQGTEGVVEEGKIAILPMTDTAGALTRALLIYSENLATAGLGKAAQGRFVIMDSWQIDIPEKGRILGPLGGFETGGAGPTAVSVRRGVSAPQPRLVEQCEPDVHEDPTVAPAPPKRPVFRVIKGGRS